MIIGYRKYNYYYFDLYLSPYLYLQSYKIPLPA